MCVVLGATKVFPCGWIDNTLITKVANFNFKRNNTLTCSAICLERLVDSVLLTRAKAPLWTSTDSCYFKLFTLFLLSKLCYLLSRVLPFSCRTSSNDILFSFLPLDVIFNFTYPGKQEVCLAVLTFCSRLCTFVVYCAQSASRVARKRLFLDEISQLPIINPISECLRRRRRSVLVRLQTLEISEEST